MGSRRATRAEIMTTGARATRARIMTTGARATRAKIMTTGARAIREVETITTGARATNYGGKSDVSDVGGDRGKDSTVTRLSTPKSKGCVCVRGKDGQKKEV